MLNDKVMHQLGNASFSSSKQKYWQSLLINIHSFHLNEAASLTNPLAFFMNHYVKFPGFLNLLQLVPKHKEMVTLMVVWMSWASYRATHDLC